MTEKRARGPVPEEHPGGSPTPAGPPSGETGMACAHLKERVVRCLWYDEKDFLNGVARTLDGRRLRVLTPGEWNTGRGPDFTGCVFRLARGGKSRGDVEVHLRRGDWRAHAHRKDPAFRGVRLHVFMQNDRPGARMRSHSGDDLTEICLADNMSPGVSRRVMSVDPSLYPYRLAAPRGLCSSILRKWSSGEIRAFLFSLGRRRLVNKARRISAGTRRRGGEEALYGLLLEALGYSRHRASFVRLSRLLPWDLIRRLCGPLSPSRARTVCEAALLGAAGLLPDVADAAWDAETARYCGTLAAAWRSLARVHGIQRMPASAWMGWGSRPANAPWRRIAAVSPLLARAAHDGLAAVLFPSSLPDSVRDARLHCDRLFSRPGESYWDRRYAWGGGRLARRASPLGRGRKDTIIINVILPYLYFRGERERALALYHKMPAAEGNSVAALMRSRLFGNGAPALRPGRAAIEQGLIHIHRRYCLRDRSGCLRCPFPALLRGRRRTRG